MMNNDLISRGALLAEYDRVHVGPPGGARKLIENAPTVDAVEVVRCGECKRWFKRHGERTEFGFCKLYPLGLAKHETGFCNFGERKDNEHIKED